MKLYATTTSERASKGQGGNQYLDIELLVKKGNINTVIGNVSMKVTDDGYEVSFYGGDYDINFIEPKGEKQKGEKCSHVWEYYPIGNRKCSRCGELEH